MIDLDIPPQVVVVEGHSFLIRRKRIRTLSFRVRPEDESVRVSVPWLMSEQRVLEFLRNQIPWIERARERWKGLKVLRPPRFEDGEEFLFRGETLKLALYRVPPSMPVRTPLLTRADGELRLYLRARDSKRACVRALDEWYRDELNRILPPILEKWRAALGVMWTEIALKRMKTRWGSCRPSTGSITLNVELMRCDPGALEYVVLHELVHLLEREHNARFRAILSEHMPEWREIEKSMPVLR